MKNKTLKLRKIHGHKIAFVRNLMEWKHYNVSATDEYFGVEGNELVWGSNPDGSARWILHVDGQITTDLRVGEIRKLLKEKIRYTAKALHTENGICNYECGILKIGNKKIDITFYGWWGSLYSYEHGLTTLALALAEKESKIIESRESGQTHAGFNKNWSSVDILYKTGWVRKETIDGKEKITREPPKGWEVFEAKWADEEPKRF